MAEIHTKQTCLTWELSCNWTWFFVFWRPFDPNSFFQFFLWWFPPLRETKLSLLVGFPLVSIFYVHLFPFFAALPSSSRQMAERSKMTLISGFAADIFVHPLSLCMRSQNLTMKFFTQKLLKWMRFFFVDTCRVDRFIVLFCFMKAEKCFEIL